MIDKQLMNAAASTCRQAGRPTIAEYLDEIHDRSVKPQPGELHFEQVCPDCGARHPARATFSEDDMRIIVKEFFLPPSFLQQHGRQLLDVLFWLGVLLMLMVTI